jgi:hypothetical protein
MLVSFGLSGKLARLMNKQDDVRRKNLRRLLSDDEVELTVATKELRWLLDEASRLQQSNDRLRRQNRRLRLKAGNPALTGDSAEEVDEPVDPSPEE